MKSNCLRDALRTFYSNQEVVEEIRSLASMHRLIISHTVDTVSIYCFVTVQGLAELVLSLLLTISTDKPEKKDLSSHLRSFQG